MSLSIGSLKLTVKLSAFKLNIGKESTAGLIVSPMKPDTMRGSTLSTRASMLLPDISFMRADV